MATVPNDILSAIQEKFGTGTVNQTTKVNLGDGIYGTKSTASRDLSYSGNVSTYLKDNQSSDDRMQFVSIGNDNSISFDNDAYKSFLFNKYKTSSEFADWTDEEIQRYVDNTAGKNGNDLLASSYWEKQNTAWEQAAKQGKEDRNTMLSELAAYKANLQTDITASLQREKSYWDARGDQAVNEYIRSSAAAGKVANPWILAGIRERATAAGASSLAARQAELQSTKNANMSTYLNLLNSVFSNTNINTTDAATALKIVQALGSGSTGIKAVAV